MYLLCFELVVCTLEFVPDRFQDGSKGGDPNPCPNQHSHFILENIFTDGAEGTIHLNPTKWEKTIKHEVSSPALATIVLPETDCEPSLYLPLILIIGSLTRLAFQKGIVFFLIHLRPVLSLWWSQGPTWAMVSAVFQMSLWDFLSSPLLLGYEWRKILPLEQRSE